jgi:diaminopimelate epimerase
MRLTKHHGLGNDFLVLLDADGSRSLSPDQVRALCDRHRGVGADGLIRATRPGDAVNVGIVAIMELTNADGSRAEMSGNGIRCLAQALVAAEWAPGPALPISTDAGLRTVTVHDPFDSVTQVSSVEMGPARVVGDAPEWAGGPFRRALLVDMGNPHLVVELAPGHEQATAADTGDVRLVELGERVNAKLPDGANVHLLAPDGDGSDGTAGVAIRTYERGVGPTLACGTGACASAAAALAWGLAGDRVPVRQPGGPAEVTLGGTAVVLRGPATFVATVDVPEPVGAAGSTGSAGSTGAAR